MKRILKIAVSILIYLLSGNERGVAQIISTVAGTGTPGFNGDGGPATAAKMYQPRSIAFDAVGNFYIADDVNNCIRKVNTSGIITTFAGNHTNSYSGDGGLATAAGMMGPMSVVADATGNIYITDYYNSRIRKVDISGIITTIVGNGTQGFSGDGGQATSAEIFPAGITFDAVGNLYIADAGNNRIRMVNSSGIITTIAGGGTGGLGDGGPATAAQLSNPQQVAFDATGNMFIAEYGNNRIRKINTSGIITTVAGNGVSGFSGDGGQATSAELNNPSGILVDAANNLFIADYVNHRIRKIDALGIITTIVGTGTAGYNGDGISATTAELNYPQTIVFDTAGNLYIADNINNRIRMVNNVAGINQLANKNSFIFVYPNPSSNSISLNIEGVSNYQNSTITIQNTLGQTVKKLSFTKNIDVSELPQGVYFIQITSPSKEIYQTKFIKQ